MGSCPNTDIDPIRINISDPIIPKSNHDFEDTMVR